MNPIIQSIKTRRSVRKFSDKPVPHELIEQVIEAGRFAASGHDRQPWAIICVEDEQTRRRLSAVNATFFDLPVKDPFYGAPVYIIVLTKKSTLILIVCREADIPPFIRKVVSLSERTLTHTESREEFFQRRENEQKTLTPLKV